MTDSLLLAQNQTPPMPSVPGGMTSPIPGAIPGGNMEPPKPEEAREIPHPQWPVWNCKLEPLRMEKTFTVGEKHLLKCEGESIKPIDKLPELSFQFESQTYSLHTLELGASGPNSLELVVTGYKPGRYQYAWVEVDGGDTGFRVEKFEAQVESLLPPGQPTQPNMNVAALEMRYPLWMWVSLLLIILIPSLIFMAKLRRKAQIKKLVEKLANSNSALRPYDQFSKDMRALVRQYNYHADPKLAPEFTVKLNEAFKTYLTRAFKLPAHVWSPSALSSELKRTHGKTYKEILKDLKDAQLEINKTESSGKASSDDADQLKKLAMVLSERIFKIQEDKSNR